MTYNLAKRITISISAVIAVALVVARLISPGLEDTADSVQHYMIARYAWFHPRMFLDQWGKPLFTLLASPFTVFGYPGMALFNALLSVLATVLAIRPLRRAGTWTLMSFAVLVMLAPYNAHLIMNGMTEVLFGVMTLLCVVLLADDRPTAAAIAASLTPLCRPEYVVFLPVIASWLLVRRQWRSLPWLVLGIGVYSLFGWLATGDALCWIHGDPYGSGNSAYGKSDPIRFIMNVPSVFGWVLVVLFIMALTLWPVVHKRDEGEREVHKLLLFTAALPALLIVAVHTWLTATGTHGSAGLVRVVGTAVPLAALFSLFTIGRVVAWYKVETKWTPVIVIATTMCALLDLFAFGPLVQPASGDQQALHAACDIAQEHRLSGDRVFSSHPYTAFRLGLDGFDPKEYRMLWGFNGMLENSPSRDRDIIVWESQMGPIECGVPLERLLDDTSFTVLGLTEPRNGHSVLGGRQYEFWTFQRIPAIRTSIADTLYVGNMPFGTFAARQDTSACNEPGAWCGAREFPWTAEHLPCPAPNVLYEEIAAELRLKYGGSQGEAVRLVLKQTRGEESLRYDERQLVEGDNSLQFRIPPCEEGVDQTLYFWAPGSRTFQVEGMRLVRTRVIQRSLSGA